LLVLATESIDKLDESWPEYHFGYIGLPWLSGMMATMRLKWRAAINCLTILQMDKLPTKFAVVLCDSAEQHDCDSSEQVSGKCLQTALRSCDIHHHDAKIVFQLRESYQELPRYIGENSVL